MSRFRNRFVRRVMAVVLSCAMVVSSSGMTALASQPSEDTEKGYYEQTEDTREESDDGDVEIAEEIEDNVSDIADSEDDANSADSEKEDKEENNKGDEDESSEVDKSSEDESSEIDESSEDESSEVDESSSSQPGDETEVYVEEETFDFETNANSRDYTKEKLEETFLGITFNNIVGDGKGHGVITNSRKTPTMVLNLSNEANITVKTCCYGEATSATMTASSGTVENTTWKEGTNEEDGTDLNGLEFTITEAEAGKVTLTFSKGTWIHSLAVEYVNEEESEDGNSGSEEGSEEDKSSGSEESETDTPTLLATESYVTAREYDSSTKEGSEVGNSTEEGSEVDDSEEEESQPIKDDTVEDKIKADPDAAKKTIKMSDADAIKIQAADIVENKKYNYAVSVTYTYKTEKDGKPVTYQQQLTEGVHYEVEKKENTDGTCYVMVYGLGETDLGIFVDSEKSNNYTIWTSKDAKEKKAKDLSKAKIKLDYKSATFTGSYITPGVTVTDPADKSKNLTEGTDYTVVYKNNVNVGKASVTVIGTKGESGYFGSATATFSIKAAPLAKSTVNIKADNITDIVNSVGNKVKAEEKEKGKDFVYKGEPITFKNLTLEFVSGNEKTTLSPSTYIVTYKKNTAKGTATATIKGLNNVSGAITISYDITNAVADTAIKDLETSTATTPLDGEYSSKGVRLTEIEVGGVTLKENVDYKADYKECSKTAELNKTEKVYITGLGSYKKVFEKVPVQVKTGPGKFHLKKSGVTVDKSKIYDKKSGSLDAKKLISAAKITDASGATIKPEAIDTTKIVLRNNKITLTPSDTTNYKESDLTDLHVATKITAALKQNKTDVLKGYFDGVNTATTTETAIVNTLTKLTATPAVLTTPGITKNDISIVSYKNNHKLGKATVIIKATDNSAYYGTMNVKFTITAVSGAGRKESSDYPDDPDDPNNPDDPKLRTEWSFMEGSELMGENGVLIQGGTGTVEGLEIDATASGAKFQTKDREEWALVGAGTIIKVPVAEACSVTITVQDSNSKYTVDGKANTAAEESFLCKGTDGYVTIEITENDAYIGLIKVESLDYGEVEEKEDSLFLYLGPDSILSGKGEIISATKYEDLDGTYVTDNLKDNNGKAQLRYPSVNLADYSYKGFNAVDLYVGYPSAKGSAEASIKVGDIEIAKFDEIAMGTNSNDWSPIKVTATLIDSNDVKNASGKVTVDITKKSGTYCGNFAYIRFYNDSSLPNGSSGGDIGEAIYLDETRTFEERAADLVARMTVDEKIAQLQYQSPAISRLDVSSYNYWKEALHGIARQGKATSFPTALSMSNTWNPELIQSMADVISDEARGKNNRYNLSYWSPTVNMARDPRWGRNEEGYGEDPYLAGQIGAAFVKGLQGTDDADNGGYLKTIATVKHFAANNNESYRRGGSSKMTEFNFRNYYTRVFQNITEEVMPASVMASYNATTIYRNGSILYNYKPSAANSYLLQQTLRRNWGFDGYVTSDCGAGDDLVNSNYYKNGLLGNTTSDKGAYLAEAFKNGLNVECYLSGYNAVSKDGTEMVEKGYLTTGELDRAVYELFLQRFKTGEFDQDGGKYRKITSSDIESPAHIDKAEEVAEETWVLLENKNNALPLNGKGIGSSTNSDSYNVVVVGNLAGAALLGDYTGAPENVVYPIDGIRTAVQEKFPDAEVNYLSAVADDEKLFNIKSINLVFENGSKKAINLSDAKNVKGMTAEGGIWKDITPSAGATFENVDITNLATIEVEMAAGAQIGGSINFAISDGPAICSVGSQLTADTDTYVVCSAKSTGKDGGYDGIRDLYITFGADSTFSVEKYKDKLDSADVIIAYAGTIPKQTTYNVSGDSDSAESNDREDIEIPAHQYHVKDICSVDAYASKSILVMSTVGQMNIEPYKDKCAAVLWTSYNGQTQGTALGKVLVGDVNPSGRLTTTWYKNADVQKMELSNTTDQKVGNISGKYTDYDIQPHGDDPGHTYQYYKNTPVYPFGYGKSYTNFDYSNIKANTSTNVGPNDKISFSIDVKNSGDRAGKEVVQLYVKYPELTGNDLNAFDQSLMPNKQLKGFKKVEIQAGGSETVNIELDVRDMYLYSEKLQKDFVPNGTYTVYIGKDASDESQMVQFTVTGNLESKIKTVKAIPDGILLKGLVDENGENVTTNNEIKPNLSTVLTDESILFDDSTGVPNGVTVEYISANPDIAVVNEKNAIVSGHKPGTTYITAKVTYNGEAKETTFPVVNEISYKPSQNEIDSALNKLEESFKAYEEDDYSTANWKELQKIKTDAEADIKKAERMADVNTLLSKAISDMKEIIAKKDIEDAKAQINEAYNELYNNHTFYKDETFAKITKIKDDGLSSVDSITKKTELKNKISEVIEDMNAIEVDNFTTEKNVYQLSSKNEKHIVNGIIDYREGGIAPYVIDGVKISGTITNNAPNNDIVMQVSDGNNIIESNIIWQIEKLDKSGRKVADIDRNTGRLTIYGNGLVRITAIDTQNDKYGTLDVYVNTQIEGEYADEANGARMDDVKNNASGLSAATNGIGNNAGSTKDYWVKYNSVRLKNIKDIFIRYSNKDKDPQLINVAVDDGKGGKTIIATLTSAAGSGQWYNWEPDTKFTINTERLNAVTLDANGCADIYIQTNALNFDYFRLTYSDSASAASYSDTINVLSGSSAFESSSNADTPVQTINWGTSEILLTKNTSTGATKIWNVINDRLKTEVNLEYFAESDVDYSKMDLKINCLAAYKDRVYAGCDNGLVVVITECPKCYKLKKVSAIDMKSMSISGETMTASDGTKSIDLNMTDIGGDSIEIDEANLLEANGGVFVDVRSAEEFAEKSVSGSVNIPVDDIQEGLASYSKDTVLIFYCASGTRANEAVKKAKDMGFTNVYNLGSIKKFGL
ncbi:MAG: hypothetical protein HDR25_01120 [Lachnospiraceae bacterium]|nr:hypothetical protein [Lachnospiraceae bacterium]